MKVNELINKVEFILNENGIKTYDGFSDYRTRLRILGLCYGEYMYTKKCKHQELKYSPNTVIECTQYASDYLKTRDWTDVHTEDHFIGIVTRAIRNQLEWNDIDYEEADRILEEEIHSLNA